MIGFNLTISSPSLRLKVKLFHISHVATIADIDWILFFRRYRGQGVLQGDGREAAVHVRVAHSASDPRFEGEAAQP